MIWHMMVAMLHSHGQLRTERDGDTEKGCQNPVVCTAEDDHDHWLAVIQNILHKGSSSLCFFRFGVIEYCKIETDVALL